MKQYKKIKESKVIIIGGGLSGLVTGNLLSHLGINSIILEQSTKIGGWNSSFKDELGNFFDYGYHALDFNRSVITTKFFQKVLHNNYVKFELKRGIVLKNYLFPYNSSISSWPKELRKLFKRENIIDNIKNNITKKKIAETYGMNFTNFIFNEVLTSYPSQYWAIRNGSREEDVLGIVYPWFFPKINKEIRKNLEWESYHDMIRKKSHQYVLYPKKGGFNGFVQAIAHNIDTNFCQIITNAKNIQLEINKKTKKVTSVRYNDTNVSTDLAIWCNSPISLLNLLNVKNLNTGSSKPQEIVFGNFVFEKNLNSNYHEILV
ncbi:MAG: NAD(P)-binding protein, partial [Nitrososphaeraceae archaeon]